RTTMLVGFPGETEKDVDELITFLEEMRFERVGVFTYSHEENTSGYKMKDDVSENIKQERAARVMAAQEQISIELNQEKVGKTLKVLIDRREGNYFIGRTEYDSPEVDNEVLIEAKSGSLQVGEFCMVNITGAEAFDLYAIPASY
ncbi:MAG: 30S ribosomal protein S12 methylthiotransferase RimO, partial [Chitinophagales bacterium]|nr:30S ribosomal protein S12 methylthiotransferase RimO [Chitinophagales bacterium]